MNKMRLTAGTATFDPAENRASLKFVVGQTASGNNKYSSMSVYNLKPQNLDDDQYEDLAGVLVGLGAFRDNTLNAIYNNTTKNVVVQ